MQRNNKQPTFTDLTVAELGGRRATAFFQRCEAEIPFTQLAESISDIYKDEPSVAGAPHWPLVLMLKIIFVQKCFGLSDPMAEEMLSDRISFRRFVGLSWDDKTPDHSTISRFRTRLRRHGHGSTLLDQSVEILRKKGLVLEKGTIIDAAIIEAPLGSKRSDGSSTADPCARAEASQPADRADPGICRASVRLDQDPAEQPPRPLSWLGAQWVGLCSERDVLELVPKLQPQSVQGGCHELSREIPRARRAKNGAGGRIGNENRGCHTA